MSNKKWQLITVILILIVMFYKLSNNKNMNNLKVVLVAKPYSTDPMDYDASVHHNTMRSIYSSLVSLYKRGEIVPQIAESWENNQDLTVWKLKINTNWKFENGESVSPEIVKRSLTRVLHIKNTQNSKSGLLEYLKDSEKVRNTYDNFNGLRIEGNYLIFEFIKPMPDFLEKISFGLYAIVHPSNFDKSGKWIDKKKIISSGKYKISEWNDQHFVISRRESDQFGDNDGLVVNKVEFIFPDDLSMVQDSQMIFSDRISNKLNEEDWKFESTLLDNKIIYIQVMSWKDKNSIFSNRENRQMLRTIFYKNLESSGLKPVFSFFPKSIHGVKDNIINPVLKKIKVTSIRTQPFSTTEYKKLNLKKSQADIFYEAFSGFCKDLDAKEIINRYPDKIEDEEKVFDIQYLGTGISVDNPIEDIKFMFRSKQGIMLPDENKEIDHLLDSRFSISDIEKKLWEQAIIWPVKHYSTGFWYRKDLNINIEGLNTSLTPIDFQFLKWKN